MGRRRIWLSVIIVMIIVVCFGVLGAALQPDSSNDLIIAVTSLGVALLALYISLKTFYSIDEVNAISRMDGNVMENPRYRPNILRFVFLFPQTGFSETSESLMSHLENLFRNKNKQSGAHLADNVQEVADMLVLVPFFIQTNNQKASSVHLERVSKLISTMKSHVENFKEISDGSCKLLEETVKLIDSVFAFQKMTANGESDPLKLLEIRGSIFINPVSCLLYNNYSGLYFLQRATAILCGHQSGLSMKQKIERASKCPSEDKSMALIYVDKASVSFKRAKECIGDDTIWKAFVCFNIARVEYMRLLLQESFGQIINGNWEEFINESIQCWITSNQIIGEHFSSKTDIDTISWLQQAMISQENKVTLSKALFQMMRHESLTDHNGNLWVKRYSDFTETTFFQRLPKNDPQNRTNSLIEDIRHFLETDK